MQNNAHAFHMYYLVSFFKLLPPLSCARAGYLINHRTLTCSS